MGQRGRVFNPGSVSPRLSPNPAARYGQSWLQIETAYLDYVVGEDSPPNLLQTTLAQLDPKQRGQLGLQLTPYNLASLLHGKIHDEVGLKRLIKEP